MSFSFSSKDLGSTKELKHHICTSDAQPVHLPPCRIPQARRGAQSLTEGYAGERCDPTD